MVNENLVSIEFIDEIDESLKKNKDFMLKLIELNKDVFRYIDNSLKDDKDILAVFGKA